MESTDRLSADSVWEKFVASSGNINPEVISFRELCWSKKAIVCGGVGFICHYKATSNRTNLCNRDDFRQVLSMPVYLIRIKLAFAYNKVRFSLVNC
jgi:hypothetical protein